MGRGTARSAVEGALDLRRACGEPPPPPCGWSPSPSRGGLLPPPPLVPNVGRPAALALGVLGAAFLLRLRALSARFDGLAAIGTGNLELQRAGERIGFGEPQLDHVADRVASAGVLADQRAGAFFVAEVFAPQARYRDQPVAAEADDCGEEAEALHPGDAGREGFADPARQPGGDVAIDRVALGLHRAALGLADRVGHF